MSAKPKLLANVPGILISFEVPYNPTCSNIINVRKVLKRLKQGDTSSSSTTSDLIQNDHSDSTVVATMTVPNLAPPSRSSHYDNIVEMLEMKYREPVMSKNDAYSTANNDTNSSMISDDSSTMNSSSTINHHHKTSKPTPSASNSTGVVTTAKKSTSNKSNGANKYDSYDLEDPFFDDSEVLEQVNVQLKSKKLKTKHDGFFVSSGRLEVETVAAMMPNNIVKHRPLTNITSNANTNDNDDNNSGSGKLTNSITCANTATATTATTTKNTSSKSASSTNSKKLLSNMTTLSATAANINDGAICTSATSAVTNSKRETSSLNVSPIKLDPVTATEVNVTAPPTTTVVVPKPKPPPTEWHPSAVETAALDVFREAVSASGLKATEKYFPYPLEAALTTLDTTAPIKSIGYMQAVCDATGGVYTIGRLRLLLSRLQQETVARKVKIQLDSMTEQLKVQLKKRVVPKPPSPPQQPVVSTTSASSADVLAEMNVATESTKAFNINTTVANNTSSSDVSVIDLTNSSQSTAELAAAATMVVVAVDSSEQQEQQQQQQEKETAEDEDGKDEGVDTTTAGNGVSTAEGTTTGVSNSGSSNSSSSSLMVPEYHFICRWDSACRVLLFDCVQLAQQWVELETAYRSKLTQADKKCRSEEQICQLDEKEVVTELLNSICQYCFPTVIDPNTTSNSVTTANTNNATTASTADCLNGDVAYLRKALVGERQRRKNKDKKALQQQQQHLQQQLASIVAPATASTSAIVGDNTITTSASSSNSLTNTTAATTPAAVAVTSITIPTIALKSPKRSATAMINGSNTSASTSSSSSKNPSPSNKKNKSAAATTTTTIARQVPTSTTASNVASSGQQQSVSVVTAPPPTVYE